MKIRNKYILNAEIGYLRRASRLLEILLEEYAYKFNKNYVSRFSIPRGRFESEGIFAGDIEFCFEKFINPMRSLKNPIITLDNISSLQFNIDFRANHNTEEFTNSPELRAIYEWNELKYSEFFEFTIYEGITFDYLEKIYNDVLNLLNEKKFLKANNITNFLYFQDRVLFVHNLYSPIAIQIDLSKKGKRSPDKMFYFINSFINLVRELGKFTEKGIEAEIPQKILINQIQKDHGILFSKDELSFTKKNFVSTKIGEKLSERFFISDFQKSTKSYNFKLLLN